MCMCAIVFTTNCLETRHLQYVDVKTKITGKYLHVIYAWTATHFVHTAMEAVCCAHHAYASNMFSLCFTWHFFSFPFTLCEGICYVFARVQSFGWYGMQTGEMLYGLETIVNSSPRKIWVCLIFIMVFKGHTVYCVNITAKFFALFISSIFIPHVSFTQECTSFYLWLNTVFFWFHHMKCKMIQITTPSHQMQKDSNNECSVQIKNICKLLCINVLKGKWVNLNDLKLVRSE